MEGDLRIEELECLLAIFPEANISLDSFSGSVELPIVLSDQLPVVVQDHQEDRSIHVGSLPSVVFEFKLPQDYPAMAPPEFDIVGSWIPTEDLVRISDSLWKLWQDISDSVIYLMIDTLKTEVMEYLTNLTEIVVTHKNTLDKLLKFDQSRKICDFNNSTFTCEICQDDKNGSLCAEFLDCKHVFCIECLKKYFTDSLQSGDIEKVHCPDYECTKRQLDIESQTIEFFTRSSLLTMKNWETKLFQLPLPEEFLTRIVDLELVERFKKLFVQHRFDLLLKEYPLRVVSCPRASCSNTFINKNDENTLCICPICKFAFCRECRRSWHGTTNVCKPIAHNVIPVEDVEEWIDTPEGSERKIELALKYGKKSMNIAVNAYLAEKAMEDLLLDQKSDIQVCPNCRMFIERSDGCNKMRCPKCNTMFCNICGEYLSSSDPYLHFKSFESQCYGKLFDGIINAEDRREAPIGMLFQ